MSRELRSPLPRDPALARASTSEVARRYHASSMSGSMVTLMVVVLGPALLLIPGFFAWYSSPPVGLAVLLGGALVVGLLAGLGPPPTSGIRAVIVAATGITMLPAILAALVAVVTTGPDHESAVSALRTCILVGTAMVVLVAAGYAGVHRLRLGGSQGRAGHGEVDPITASVLAAVDADLRAAVAASGGREIIRRAAEDPAGRARLELETRWMDEAGYTEVRRSRVTIESTGVELMIAIGTGLESDNRPSIEVAFARRSSRSAPGPAADADGTGARPPSAVLDPRLAPDPEMAATALQWQQSEVEAEMDEETGAARPWGGLARVVGTTAVIGVLVAQGVGLFGLASVEDARLAYGTPSDPWIMTACIAFIVILPLVTGWVAGLLRGVHAWWVAVVPLIAALVTFFAFAGGSAGVQGVLTVAGAGAILSAPWTVGWVAGLLVRRWRGARRSAGTRAGARSG
jgi:hypothetical protein